MQIDLRVLWPERAAVVVVAVIAGGILSLWFILALGVGSLRDAGLNRAAFGWFVDGELGLALPLWLGLRAIHTCIALVRRSRQTRRDRGAVAGKAPNGSKTSA